mgnify:CR=1 FL=1
MANSDSWAIAIPSSGGDAGLPPSAHRAYFPRHQRRFGGEPVAVPGALRIAALLHRDAVEGAPAVLAVASARAAVPLLGARVPLGAWPLAGGVLVACWAASACCTACWMQGLQVGRGARGAGGLATLARPGPCARPRAAGGGCRAWACRSRAWSRTSWTHGTRCCTRLVSSASLTSRMVYISSSSPMRSRRQQLAGASVDIPAVGAGRRSWRRSCAEAWRRGRSRRLPRWRWAPAGPWPAGGSAPPGVCLHGAPAVLRIWAEACAVRFARGSARRRW